MNAGFFTIFFTLLKKEFLLGLRTKESFFSIIFFTFLVVLIFHFGFSFENKNITPYITSFVWLAGLFGGMLRLNQTYEPENTGKVMDGMRQIPHIATPFFLSKFLYNLLFILVLELFTFIMLIILFNLLNPWLYFSANWPPFLLGTIGLSCVGTVFSNMVISHNRREIILSIIAYPILIPIIIGVLSSFTYSATGNVMGLNVAWLKILAVFDIIYLTLSIMVFDALIKA